MHPVVRSVLAVAAGVVVALALVTGIESVGHAVYPVPAGLDFSNREQMDEYVRGLPPGALMFVLAAWIVAAFGGGWLAAVLARTRPMLHAGIVGAFMLAATIANLLIIPPPTWFAVTGIVGVILGALAGGRLASARSVR